MNRSLRSTPLLTTILLGALGCGGGGTTDPPASDPLRIDAITPLSSTGEVGTSLTVYPAVRVSDSKGPKAGITVNFQFINGPFVGPILTDQSGEAGVPWELGPYVSTYRMIARLGTADSIVFEATATPGPLALLTFASLAGGAIVGQPLLMLPTAKAADRFGNPLSGIPIHFEIQTGGGVLTGADQTSNHDGYATPASWTLGPSDREQRLLVTTANLRDSVLAYGMAAGFEALTPLNQRVHTSALAPVNPAVRALDALGKPMPNVFVEAATVSSGASGLEQYTDSSGIVRLQVWRAAPEPGDNVVHLRTPGHAGYIFSLTGVLPGAKRVEIHAATIEPGMVGNFLATRPTFRLFDSTDRPLGYMPVEWTLEGDGSVIRSASVTDAEGVTWNDGWRLGTRGTHTLIAKVPLLPPITFTATADPLPPANFSIVTRVIGKPPALNTVDSLAVANGGERWHRVLRGDLPPVTLTEADSVICGDSVVGTIDDVLVYVLFSDFDGPGNMLGGAAPCVIRTASSLPAVGLVILDSTDVLGKPAGLLADVLAHEIGHVLGIGTLWEYLDLLKFDADAGGIGYSGPFGRTALHGLATDAQFFVRRTVPVYGDLGHWAEAGSPFGAELMTPFIGESNVLSALSVAALRDLGYQASDADAEPFTFPAFLSTLKARERPTWRERAPAVVLRRK